MSTRLFSPTSFHEGLAHVVIEELFVLIEAPPLETRARDFLLRFYMLIPRIKFRWKERRRAKAMREAVSAMRRIRAGAVQLELPNVIKAYNLGLYILLLELDWAEMNWDMIHASNDWRRKYVARQMAVLLYEASEDLTQLLGQNYRDTLKSLGIGSELLQELGQISRQLNRFKESNQVFLKRIRTFVGAHRDHDAAAQLDILDSLEPLKVYSLAGDFYAPLRALVDLQVRLIPLVGNIESLLKQYLKTNHQPPVSDGMH